MARTKKIIKHLEGDIKTFKKEAAEDKELISSLKRKSKKKKKNDKVETVMHEFKEGKLKSGSKKGPRVKSRKQAIAIALSEARKAGEKVGPKRKRKRK